MTAFMTKEVTDYTPLLREAIAEAKAAGFETAAHGLEQSCFAVAYTTSSEMLGEHGLAIERFLKDAGGTLPGSTRKKLRACLAATGRAWPAWRALVAFLRWP